MRPEFRVAIVAAAIIVWLLVDLLVFHRERERQRRREFTHITASRRWWKDADDGPEGDH